MLTADCFPITVAPGLHRLFLDYCAGDAAVRRFYASLPPDSGWQARPARPTHWAELVALLAEQNVASATEGTPAAKALETLKQGAGVVVTGQQVGLFGGPLFTPFKAATAVARARQATANGQPHAAIFWLASEDHDFAEINHVVFPASRELKKLVYAETEAESTRPVGGVVLDERIAPLIDQAWELLGISDAMEALAAAYQPGRTFAQAFAEFYAKAFAAQGLLVLDAGRPRSAPHGRAGTARRRSSRPTSCMRRWWSGTRTGSGRLSRAGGCRGAVEPAVPDRREDRRADGAEANCAERAEPQGLWQAGKQSYSTADLVGILEASRSGFRPRRCCGRCFRIICWAPR